ncbi:heme oxygenase-like multi-helical [Penicillium soppii]|uniref:heme oxygenase-like multi-helical n=1 Tax=Penicillium soppii TaxID=69789 RepID=UPI0025488B13|nr:heme oxygenase-like multi-helical [Penicillium soppii]KAJ5861391.1 heme oxygenase-like multi-helical [Penicillium soppii]
MTTQGPLTAYLLASTPDALTRATTHPFLAAAGRGTLPKPLLSQWLSQDRLYAQSYIRYIGLLLAKIRLPAQNSSTAVKQPTSEQKAINVLIDALVNIRTELAFFEKTAEDHALDLTAITAEEGACALTSCGNGSYITTSSGISTSGSGSCPGFTGGNTDIAGPMSTENTTGHALCVSQGECQMPSGSDMCVPSEFNTQPVSDDAFAASRARTPAPEAVRGGIQTGLERSGTLFFCASRTTRAYIDMFMSAGSTGVSVMEGMAVLWATEVCYLRSWRYAARCMRENGNKNGGGDYSGDADGGALRGKFIDNWSSVEFEGFVNQIGDVLDEMAGQIKGAEESEIMRGRCLEWWRQIVWLEEKFWPELV